jgi:hypothetical protein
VPGLHEEDLDLLREVVARGRAADWDLSLDEYFQTELLPQLQALVDEEEEDDAGA